MNFFFCHSQLPNNEKCSTDLSVAETPWQLWRARRLIRKFFLSFCYFVMSDIGKSLSYLSTVNEDSFQNVMLSCCIWFSIITKRQNRGGVRGVRKVQNRVWERKKNAAIPHRNLWKYRNFSLNFCLMQSSVLPGRDYMRHTDLMFTLL